MNRLTSYGFIFVMIILAILEGSAGDHAILIKALALSVLLAYGAFFLTWLTLDATLPVIVLGTAILGFGGWILAIAVVVFFITSSLLTRLNLDRSASDREIPEHEVRRDGMQIWANGFWIAFFCMLFFLSDMRLFLAAAFAAVATATADTWATEIGIRNPGKTINLVTRNMVEPGTNGGVSLKGSLFAFLGALIIGFFASQGLYSNPVSTMAATTVGGLLGCFIDSYIGALYQNRTKRGTGFSYWDNLDEDKQNSFVNWVSTGSGGIIALLLLLII